MPMETMTFSFFSNLTTCRGLFVLSVVALTLGGSAGAYAQQVPPTQVGPSGAEPVATDSRPADSLTIERVVDQVLETYPSIEASRKRVDAAEARVGQARSGYWPRIEAVGTYRRQDPVPEISVPGAPSGPNQPGGERTVGIQPNNLYDGHLQVRQTLYDFGRTRARIDQAEAGRTTAERQVDTERSDLAFQAIQVYYTTLLADARIHVQRRQIEQLEQTLEVVRRRQDAGAATEFEVQSTLSRLSEARSQLTRLESRRQSQQSELGRLLGRASGDSPALSGALDSHAAATSPVDVEALADSALLQHPSVQVAKARLQATRRQVQVADQSDAPNLALTAEGGVKNGYPADLNEPRLNHAVGLSLRVPLFEGFATERRVEEAEAEVQAAEARLTDVRRQVETRVEQAASTLRARLHQLEATKTRLEQARTAAQLARTRYEAGTITNLELLEAETELLRARLARTEVQYEVVMGRYVLQHAAGTLLPFETPSP
jgi:outer membrane protein